MTGNELRSGDGYEHRECLQRQSQHEPAQAIEHLEAGVPTITPCRGHARNSTPENLTGLTISGPYRS